MSTTTYFKAIKPSGTSFHDTDFRWLPEDLIVPEGGYLVEHPDQDSPMLSPANYLSVSSEEADCTGFRWPCRLLEVEAVGEVFAPSRNSHPNKRVGKSFRVVREIESWRVFGPNGKTVAAVIERTNRLTAEEASALVGAHDLQDDTAWRSATRGAAQIARDAAWKGAWDAAEVANWDAARNAAWDAAWNAAWNAARNAAWEANRDAAWEANRDAAPFAADAAVAELTKDLVSKTTYERLMGPWRSVITD